MCGIELVSKSRIIRPSQLKNRPFVNGRTPQKYEPLTEFMRVA